MTRYGLATAFLGATLALASSGCAEFLEAVAAGAGGMSSLGGQHRSAVTGACFSDANCEADQVCAIARGAGHGICVNSAELARQ